MEYFSPPEFEDGLLFDLLDEITTHVDECETALVMLERDQNNSELLAHLFRSVHTIKGDIQIVNMEPMVPLISAVEDILGMLRAGEISFNNLISDLALTVLEMIQIFVDDSARYSQAKYDPEVHNAALRYLHKVNPSTPAENEIFLTQALLKLDPTLSTEVISTLDKVVDTPPLHSDWESEIKTDLIFFEDLMGPIERRMDNWKGRGARQLKLARALNHYSGSKVDDHQLAAAVLLHDIGMALVPMGLMRKQNDLSEDERYTLNNHLIRSANILSDIPHWDEARSFILAHHERFDGKGYPNGLSGSEIPDGAKILALVDTFEAMTHDRSQITHRKRPIAVAAQEIALNSGSQLCPYWTNIFTEVISSLLRKRA